MKAHPNVHAMEKGSREEQDFNWRAKQQMHAALKKGGLTLDEHKQGCREEKRERDLKSGKAEKKICVT
tara:strand:+ start:8843 stop:9046 length:204 start_codon:yes stop_codon:yes gene_type:complete